MAIVFIPSQLRSLAGGATTLSIPGATVLEVLNELDRRCPGVKQRLCQGDSLAPGLQVSVDHVMTGRGLRAKLQPDSELHFLPAFGGG